MVCVLVYVCVCMPACVLVCKCGCVCVCGSQMSLSLGQPVCGPNCTSSSDEFANDDNLTNHMSNCIPFMDNKRSIWISLGVDIVRS